MTGFERRYTGMVTVALERKKLVLIITGIVLAGSLALFTAMKTEFIPSNDEGMIRLDLEAP